MIWGRLAACAVVGLCAVSGGVALADTMVVRASGPSAKSYPPGAKLAANGSLVLKAGDVITLLDGKGTRTLRGPGNFGVAAAASAAPANGVMLSALLDSKRVRRARTGAVRGGIGEGATAQPRRPNLWMVDLNQPGPVCIADLAAVKLWRADAARAATVRISGNGISATAQFAAGEAVAAWPATAPVRDGADYSLNGTQVRFALVDTADPALDRLAASLIGHGCTAQLDQLVDTAALADARN